MDAEGSVQAPPTSEFRLEVLMMLRGRHWHNRVHWLLPSAIPLLGYCMIGGGFGSMSPSYSSNLCIYAAAAVLAIVVGAIVNRWTFARSIRALPAHGRRTTCSFNDANFSQALEDSSACVAYSLFYRTVRTPEGFLLYPQKRLLYWVPRDSFSNPEDFEGAAEILARESKHTVVK